MKKLNILILVLILISLGGCKELFGEDDTDSSDYSSYGTSNDSTEINCNNAWRGPSGDHGQYYCLSACANPSSQNVSANCAILKELSTEAANLCSKC